MTLRGQITMNDGYLQLPTGDFDVKNVQDNEFTISDGEVYNTLKRVHRFYRESLGKDSMKRHAAFEPTALATADITGDWPVYRSRSESGPISGMVKIIRRLTITEAADKTLSGTIEFMEGNNSFKEQATFVLSGSELKATTPNGIWTILTLNASNGEFVFTDDTKMGYFSKN